MKLKAINIIPNNKKPLSLDINERGYMTNKLKIFKLYQINKKITPDYRG